MRAKKQQGANSDRVMRVYENRCRCATAADFFQDFAIGHLREAASAIFLRRRHPEHADAPETINYPARNVCLPIYLRRIEVFVQKFAESSERFVQFGLLRRGNTRIRHHPIRYEMPLEKSVREPQRLRPCKKQFLRLLDFFLSLRVEFVHSVEQSKKWRRTVAGGARVSNQVRQLRFENPCGTNPESVGPEARIWSFVLSYNLGWCRIRCTRRMRRHGGLCRCRTPNRGFP